jgi:hypothetical protein
MIIKLIALDINVIYIIYYYDILYLQKNSLDYL